MILPPFGTGAAILAYGALTPCSAPGVLAGARLAGPGRVGRAPTRCVYPIFFLNLPRLAIPTPVEEPGLAAPASEFRRITLPLLPGLFAVVPAFFAFPNGCAPLLTSPRPGDF